MKKNLWCGRVVSTLWQGTQLCLVFKLDETNSFKRKKRRKKWKRKRKKKKTKSFLSSAWCWRGKLVSSFCIRTLEYQNFKKNNRKWSNFKTLENQWKSNLKPQNSGLAAETTNIWSTEFVLTHVSALRHTSGRQSRFITISMELREKSSLGSLRRNDSIDSFGSLSPSVPIRHR